MAVFAVLVPVLFVAGNGLAPRVVFRILPYTGCRAIDAICTMLGAPVMWWYLNTAAFFAHTTKAQRPGPNPSASQCLQKGCKGTDFVGCTQP